MPALLIAFLVLVALAAVFFIFVPRGPSKDDIVREKIRHGKARKTAAIDPLTAQLLVDPTEDLRIPGNDDAIVVRVNLETAQRYRLHGLAPFRAVAESLEGETRTQVFCRRADEPDFRFAEDPSSFYGMLLGDGEFDAAFDVLVARIDLIDRYADAFPGEREHDELMEEASDALKESDALMAELKADESDFGAEATEPQPMRFDVQEPSDVEPSDFRGPRTIDPFSPLEPAARGSDRETEN